MQQVPCTYMTEPLLLRDCLYEVCRDLRAARPGLVLVDVHTDPTATERSEGGSAAAKRGLVTQHAA